MAHASTDKKKIKEKALEYLKKMGELGLGIDESLQTKVIEVPIEKKQEKRVHIKKAAD